MKQTLALLLALLMLSSMLFGCNFKKSDGTEVTTPETQLETEAVTDHETDGESTAVNTTESETEERVEVTTLPIDGEFAASIVEADNLAGKVNAYFESGIRDKLTVTNDDVILNMGLSADAGGSISSITTKESGRVTPTRDLQSLKASHPISVTPWGTTKISSDSQPLNA